MPQSLSSYRSLVNELIAKRNYAASRANEERAAQRTALANAAAVAEATEIAAAVAQGVQQAAHKRLAGVVSRCLAAVFDDPYEFQLIFERKRGKTEARIAFMRRGEEVDPMDGSGGGPVDVAAFALRLAALTLTTPKPRPLLFLDEPFRFVHSPDYRERVKNLLLALSSEMDVQIVMVTGVEEICCGKIIDLS